MTTYTILVTLSTFAEYDPGPLEMLKLSGVPFRLNSSGKRITSEQLIATGREATVIIAGVEPYDEPTLSRLPALRCISRCGAGADPAWILARQSGGGL